MVDAWGPIPNKGWGCKGWGGRRQSDPRTWRGSDSCPAHSTILHPHVLVLEGVALQSIPGGHSSHLIFFSQTHPGECRVWPDQSH